MGKGQGGSLCADFMRPGHYPWQLESRPRIGSRNHLLQPPRHAGLPDVLRIAFIPGDEKAAIGRTKSAGLPPVDPQGPDGAKSTVFVIRAENGGEGLDIDDLGRVPWKLILSKELWKEMEGNRSVWLSCII